MSDDRRGTSGFGAAFVILIVVGVIAKFWVWIVVVVGVILLGVALGLLLYRFDQRRLTELGRLAAIARRADEQHAQILAGDPRGMYGIYPPAKPPPVDEPRPHAGENWADYLAETRRKALAGDDRGVHDYRPQVYPTG